MRKERRQMDGAHLKALRCPKCSAGFPPQGVLIGEESLEEGAIVCQKGHVWPVEAGIPSLVYPPLSEEDTRWIAEYDQMAPTYDESVATYSDFLGVDLDEERKNIAHLVPIEGSVRILDVSVGTGANFSSLNSVFKGKMGRFNLHGIDVSKGMLQVAKEKALKGGYTVSLTHGSVFNLPYPKDSFDLILHSGGINTFSDIPLALTEMLRVVRPGGNVVVIDEGLSPQKRDTPEGQAIMKANSLFASHPPLKYIPDRAKNVEVTYIMNEAFYQIMFSK
jgi:ubiquinone/menaquinone biosynthesis C-methylase UbiE